MATDLQDLCLAHHGFAFLADFGGDLEWVPAHQLRPEQLDRKRSGVLFLGQLLEDAHHRRDAVAGNQPRIVIDQLAGRIEQILEMRMGEFARLEQVQIFELAESRPEVEEVEHGSDVGMRRLSDHLER